MAKVKPNIILEDHGEWLLIDISTGKFPNVTSKIDRDDFDSIAGRISIGSYGYPITNVNRVPKFVHKLIAQYEITDHINRDRTDNRQSNLREVTWSQNGMNKAVSSRNNTGTTGVVWVKGRNKWKAEIIKEKVHRHIGYFLLKSDAIEARKRAEIEVFGEYRAV